MACSTVLLRLTWINEKRRLMAEIIKQTQQQQKDNEELEHDEDLINGVPDKDDLENND